MWVKRLLLTSNYPPVGQLITPVEIVEYEENRVLLYQAHAGPQARGRCVFQPCAEGTELIYELKLMAGGLFRLLRPMLNWFMARQTRGDLAKLKALLEGAM